MVDHFGYVRAIDALAANRANDVVLELIKRHVRVFRARSAACVNGVGHG